MTTEPERQSYEPPNCGSTRPHDEHVHSPLGGLTVSCPGAARRESPGTRYRVTLHVHDRTPERDLDLEASLTVTVLGRHSREDAREAADGVLRLAGLGPAMDRDDARVSLSVNLL